MFIEEEEKALRPSQIAGSSHIKMAPVAKQQFVIHAPKQSASTPTKPASNDLKISPEKVSSPS